jgi:hypothetical protein
LRAMRPLSKLRSEAVTVCGTVSLFVQRTVPPTATLIVRGTNWLPVIETETKLGRVVGVVEVGVVEVGVVEVGVVEVGVVEVGVVEVGVVEVGVVEVGVVVVGGGVVDATTVTVPVIAGWSEQR